MSRYEWPAYTVVPTGEALDLLACAERLAWRMNREHLALLVRDYKREVAAELLLLRVTGQILSGNAEGIEKAWEGKK